MFSQKILEITIALGEGTFDGGGNTKTMKGYASYVRVEKVGLPDKNKCSLGIYGLNLADMAQMTTLAFLPLETQKNYVRVRAGEIIDGVEGELSQVFVGEITKADADFSASPDVVFIVEALAGYYPALTAIEATSAQGSVPIADIMQKLAGQAGYTYTNQGVSGSMVDPYFDGNAIEQIRKISRAYNFHAIIDDDEVITMPNDEARKGNTVFLSKDTGLLGYPTFTGDGISLNCMYNGAFQLGGTIEVESIVPKASGTWRITKLSHNLSAFITGENIWESNIEAVII